MRKSWSTVSNSPGALCRISSSVASLIPGERTSATPRSVLQISDRHLRRYPILIALPIWIWIKFYPCPHRPDARRLCQNYSTIHVDMDKIGFIHIHTDEIPAVCVKIIALPIWIWIKFYPCPHRREARQLCRRAYG